MRPVRFCRFIVLGISCLDCCLFLLFPFFHVSCPPFFFLDAFLFCGLLLFYIWVVSREIAELEKKLKRLESETKETKEAIRNKKLNGTSQ